MLSFSKADSEEFSRPLCSQAQYERKMDNYHHVEASFVARDEDCKGLPIQIHLEPSGDCNLFCPVCPKGRRKIKRQGFLSFDAFEKVFYALHETLLNIIIRKSNIRSCHV
jgi:hypothetical protein